MRKNIVNQKDYYKLADNYRNNPADLMTIGEIFTMSAIKSLLGKRYTPYFDDLRRTYGRNKSAQKLAELWELIAEVEEERKPHQADKRKTERKLTDITTPADKLDELNEQLDDIQKNIDQLSDDLKVLKKVATAGENLTPLEDCFQEFRLYYQDYTPKANDYTDRLNHLLGLDREPLDPNNYEPATPLENRTDTDTDGAELRKPPTKRQLENRQQWATLDGRQKRGALEHLARIKNGQRAVNRWLRTQGNKTADYGGNTISLTTAGKNGEKIVGWTHNTLIEDLASKERVRALLQGANLNPDCSSYLDYLFSKDAQKARIQARADYYEEHYESMVIKQGKRTRFVQGMAKAGDKAEENYAFEKIGITASNRKSDLKKTIKDKLRQRYEEQKKARKEHQETIIYNNKVYYTKPAQQADKLEQNHKPALITKNGKLYRKKVVKGAGDPHSQQNKLVIVPAPHREPQSVVWLTRAEHLEKLEQMQHDKDNRWTVAEPTAEQSIINELYYHISHKNDTPHPAEHISGLSDSERAKHRKSMADRTARAEKLESWNYKPARPKPAPAPAEPKQRTAEQLEQLADQQRTATAKSWSIEKHWQSIRAREEQKNRNR